MNRYRLAAEDAARSADAVSNDLPSTLTTLLDRSERLYDRVRHLDRRMYVEVEPAAAHPVLSQLDRLKTAIGGF